MNANLIIIYSSVILIPILLIMTIYIETRTRLYELGRTARKMRKDYKEFEKIIRRLPEAPKELVSTGPKDNPQPSQDSKKNRPYRSPKGYLWSWSPY